ncbi:MAG: cytochrome c peroxidase [Methylobacter sp.]|jgi:cytochrome c peroxidase
MKTNNLIFGAVMSTILAVGVGGQAMALDIGEEDYNLKLLGKYGFFDKISNPPRMACVTCHDPATGGTGSVSGVNLHQVAITGANPHTVGSLKPPTNLYAALIKPFAPCGRGGLGANNKCGGNFWDGRAEGRPDVVGFPGALFPDGATRHIGEEVFYTTNGAQLQNVSQYADYFGPTADQALNPMPNIVEQNIERKAVCEHVKSAKYAELYELAWGVPIDCSEDEVTVQAADVTSLGAPSEKAYDISFKRYILAICAWQHSKELNSFSSKRDKALQRELDGTDPDPTPGKFPLVGFTPKENLGHDLFYNTRPNPFGNPANPLNQPPRPDLPVTNCSFCHLTDLSKPDGTGLLERYSDDAYHNIGTPANPELPAAPNPGIRGHIGNIVNPGFFKVPTMRNVDKRKGKGFIKAYTHNGYFKSLESILHFYNTSAIANPAAAGNQFDTANSFGVVKCESLGIQQATEKQALANNCWPAPEWPGASAVLVGNLHLTAEQEAAIVAYLKTFTDTETVKAPAPYK